MDGFAYLRDTLLERGRRRIGGDGSESTNGGSVGCAGSTQRRGSSPLYPQCAREHDVRLRSVLSSLALDERGGRGANGKKGKGSKR